MSNLSMTREEVTRIQHEIAMRFPGCRSTIRARDPERLGVYEIVLIDVRGASYVFQSRAEWVAFLNQRQG